MNKIVNLTQHKASQEQVEKGVFDLTDNTELKVLLTVNDLPTPDDIYHRVAGIVEIAKESGAKSAMIGGAPFLMSALEKELKSAGIQPLYAFTKRVAIEENGVKTSIFKHEGFVKV